MTLKKIYIVLFCISISLFAQDPREKNHSINIIPFIDEGVEKYYISWSSSSGSDDGWQHDIYTQKIFFVSAENINYENEPNRFIGTGYDEAQEPVQVAINPNNNVMLSVWEDGSGSTVDIRGQMHYPDGTIIKSNWIIDGGINSQHSPDVVHVNNYFLVSLTDEAPPAQTSMNVLKILDDSTGEEKSSFELSPTDKDQWWAVISSDNLKYSFVGWGDGENFYGCVIKTNQDTITKTEQKFYLSNIDQYYYSVAWLNGFSKFIAIAKVNDNSVACLIDTNGVRSSFTTIYDAPITRETDIGVRWDDENRKFQIIYTSGIQDITLLSVTGNSINLEKINKNIINDLNWPITGIACKFVNSTTGNDLWESDRKILIAHNDENSNSAIYHFLSLEDLTNVEMVTSELFPRKFELYPAYPNPFNPSTTIKYSLPAGRQKSQIVTLKVYDIIGREVATLVSKEQNAGSYEVVFDSKNLSSGIYYYRINVGASLVSSGQTFVKTKKMILIK